MEVKLAQKYGFCFGVKRAIRIAEDNVGSTTFGPLIHNNKEIERLKLNFNVETAENIEDLKTQKIIVRTHGITKNDLLTLKNDKKIIVDATCPFVRKPQKIIEEMDTDNYHIIIFGDKNHPEVKSVMSYATNCSVILTTDEIDFKKVGSKVAVVSQTTRKSADFLKIIQFLVNNIEEVRIFNTICNATYENQEAAKELSFDVDIMIIVGGKNSSNTKQLYSICKINCDNSYLIEDKNDLLDEWFIGKKLCGITAGASTPDWIIDGVVKKIKEY